MPEPTVPLAEQSWQDRLGQVDSLMREISNHTDPQDMVRSYAQRMRALYHNDGIVGLSRRDLASPKYRITRSHLWKEAVDPWLNPHKLPVFDHGLLGDLLYAGKPQLILDLKVPPNDPAAEHLQGVRAMLTIPHYEKSVATNMVCVLQRDPAAIDPQRVPELVWLSSLFGRAAGNLALSRSLAITNAKLDREMKIVADIQRALLPIDIPQPPGLNISAHYQTSQNAGGDYYDFFPLANDRLGMLIADVSGHGTPAAVLMAIMHAIAHLVPSTREQPAEFLAALNHELASRYALSTPTGMMFVTAFYAVYDPHARTLLFSSAGHNPPRIRVGFVGPGGPVLSLDQAQGLPLGVIPDAAYTQHAIDIDPGDALMLYTDGITETFAPDRAMFGTDRLDEILSRQHENADACIRSLLSELDAFAAGAPPTDDRTIILAQACTHSKKSPA